MNLDCNVDKIGLTEFGVGRDEVEGQIFVAVPVDAHAQTALQEMVAATWQAMRAKGTRPPKYEPSEKHESIEYLHLRLNDKLAEVVRNVHQAANLPLDPQALEDPTTVFCYFARMTDVAGRRLTALRRAAQFKGVLKSRLLRFATDSLKLIEDHVFKLDTDFDLLVDSANVHILRPSGFEFTGKLQEAIVAAVPHNVSEIQARLPFVELSGIEEYASERPRAARYLASIRSQFVEADIDLNALRELCQQTGVTVTESQGVISVQPGDEMAFLEVLDRRRYQVELIKGTPERYKAASRTKIT